MNSTELFAYMLTGVTLAASCAAFYFSLRPAFQSPRFTHYVFRLTPGIAFLLLITGLTMRGIAAGRWPVGTTFEFTLAFAASVLLVYMMSTSTRRQRAKAPTTNALAGAIATLLALLLMLHAFFLQPETARAIQLLPPVMGGVWFALHTLLTALAYGALTLSGSVALPVLLIKPSTPPDAPLLPLRRECTGDKGHSTFPSTPHDIPLLPKLGEGAGDEDHTAFVDHAMAIGYIALSLGMIAGGVWGERAWGDYWNWSIKEAWTLTTWLVCTFYYHVRHRRGWRGRRALCIAVLALLAVAITFFFTPTLLYWTRLQRWRIY